MQDIIGRRSVTLLAGFLAGFLGLGGLSSAASGASIAPHSAVYELKLSKQHSDRGVTFASGRIEFELTDSCDGWMVRQRTRLNMTNAQGHALDTGWIFDAWEAKDGLAYRFSVKRLRVDGQLEEVRGKAELDADSGGGSVIYSVPEGRSEALPAGTVFPAQHNLDVMRAAADEELLLWREVFDGAGNEGLFGVNAAVVGAIPLSKAPSLPSPLMDGVESWRVQMAYYPQSDQSSEPNYQQAQRLYANGIVDEMVFDYDDFALDAKLQSLKALPAAQCN